MRYRPVLIVLTLACALLTLTPAASAAENPFCLPGSSAGKCENPQGVATDFETGRVYVADQGNNRVNVFSSDGTFIESFGPGQLKAPTWVAVDNDPTSASHHEVWVTTEKEAGAEFLVKKFTPSGELIEADSFGKAREKVPPEASEACRFAPNDPIAVGPEGKVYVADSYDKDGTGPGHIFVNRVLTFELEAGTCLGEVGGKALFEGEFETIRNFAVDSEGHIYVTVEGAGAVIRKYSSSGTLEHEFEHLETQGITVDAEGKLFAKQRSETVVQPLALAHFFTEYAPDGKILRRFDYEVRDELNVPGLAPNLDSTEKLHLYASQGTNQGSEGVRDHILPPPGPVLVPGPCRVKEGGLGNDKATLVAEVNPEGKATIFSYEYLTQAKFEAEGNQFKGAKSSPEEPLAEGATDFELHEAAQQITSLEPETEYRCRVVARNADSGPEGTIGQEGAFKTREGFEFGFLWSHDVGQEEATIFAEGNPLGIPASGEIEYVEDAAYQASGFEEAQAAPEELDFGASDTMQLRSLTLKGLTPGTLYHYRLRAKNGTPPEGIICPERKAQCPELERTFRTYPVKGGEADDRGWELVSPGLKNSADVAIPGGGAGLFEPRSTRIQAGAGSGEAITYTSWISFGKAEGAPSTNQYLSKRSEGGWETENVSPYGFMKNTLFAPYLGFSADLRYGAFKTTEPPLTSDCRKNEDLYLRDNDTGQLRCLTPEGPEGPESDCLDYAGLSEDGSRAFLAGKPVGGKKFEYSLYEATASGTQLISVFPNGEPAPPTQGTAFGFANTTDGITNCQAGHTILRHAVSTDGSRAYWTYVPEAPKEGTLEPTSLFVRLNGSETKQLDALPKKEPGKGPEGSGVLRSVSADGSVAYFTDTGKLTKGSKAKAGEPDLYRYEPASAKPLTDLTEGSVPGDVKGVVGTSEDGSYLYFVAGAVLGGESASGETPTQGAANLYLFHEGETRFIGTLASPGQAGIGAGDQGDWAIEPHGLSARVSPDGKHLAFLSIEAQKLAGYENRIASGQHCEYNLEGEGGSLELVNTPLCSEAFLYDAESEALICASCNPSGSRPQGPTVFPGWTNAFEGPRFLSDDGKRVFFESLDPLLPGDENGKLDVYEFELAGEGSCDASNPNFDLHSGGCQFLVSSGRSEDESYLLDASSNGRDVFFSTRQALSGWDENENFDVYDYREGGGFPEPPAEVNCEAEVSCKPPVSTPPPSAAAATPFFKGQGNQLQPKKEKQKPKHSRKPHKKKHAKHNAKAKKKGARR